jgi:type VI protein secretion system component VasF
MQEVSDGHRHRWAAGNAVLSTAVIVFIEPSRLGERAPLTALALLVLYFVLAFSFWQLVFWITRGKYVKWTKQDR